MESLKKNIQIKKICFTSTDSYIKLLKIIRYDII